MNNNNNIKLSLITTAMVLGKNILQAFRYSFVYCIDYLRLLLIKNYHQILLTKSIDSI